MHTKYMRVVIYVVVVVAGVVLIKIYSLVALNVVVIPLTVIVVVVVVAVMPLVDMSKPVLELRMAIYVPRNQILYNQQCHMPFRALPI